jgi:hypothetical protein
LTDFRLFHGDIVIFGVLMADERVQLAALGFGISSLPADAITKDDGRPFGESDWARPGFGIGGTSEGRRGEWLVVVRVCRDFAGFRHSCFIKSYIIFILEGVGRSPKKN